MRIKEDKWKEKCTKFKSMASSGFELTPSESAIIEDWSLTTTPRSDWITVVLKWLYYKSIFLWRKGWLKLVELYLYEFKDTFEENSLKGIISKPFCIILVVNHSRVQQRMDVWSWNQSLIWSISHTDQLGKNQFIFGLPQCNMNSKVQIFRKSKVLMVKRQSETHLIMNKKW